MKIDSATIQFSTANRQREASLRQQSGSLQAAGTTTGRVIALQSQYELRENVQLQSSQSAYLYSKSQVSCAGQTEPAQVLTQESLVQSMVSHAFSRQVRINQLVPLQAGSAAGTPSRGAPVATQLQVAYGQAYRYEAEQQSALTMEGRITLADQRTIDFVLHTRLDSQLLFESGSGEFARFALRTDPLILNLHGGAAQLTDAAFEFDLDNDGKTDSISMATGGSGFIAFDRNNDGVINNGSELFGTRSGDGFAELAKYDDDGNGFIDAADSIYAQLKFWNRDENGNDQLQSLQSLGVGAIGLSAADTPVQLRGQSHQETGTIRSTGIFLFENGAVGTLQQVDLALRNQDAESQLQTDFTSAQFVPVSADDAAVSPERRELDAMLQRLNALRDEALARLDEQAQADSKDGRTLLEQLVDMLEQQIQELAEKRRQQQDDSNDATAKA